MGGDVEGDAGHPRAVRKRAQTAGVHVVDRARATLLELVLQSLHGRIEALDVPDREKRARVRGQLGQLLRRGDVHRERLLREDGDAGAEKRGDDLGDDAEGDRHDRDVKRLTRERLVEPGVGGTSRDCRTNASRRMGSGSTTAAP